MLALLLFAAFAPTHAAAQSEPVCISDLKLTEGKENWYNQFENSSAQSRLVKVGTWRADTLGAGDDKAKFSDQWVTLSAQQTPQSFRQCLTGIRLQATEFDKEASLYGDFVKVGHFDVRRNGGKDTDGRFGDDKFTLSYRRMQDREMPQTVKHEVYIKVTPTDYDSRQNLQGGWIGWWDVDNGEAAAGDGPFEHGGSIVLGAGDVPFAGPLSNFRLVYSGKWEEVSQCGGPCLHGVHEVKYGVVAGKEFSSRKEVQEAISAAIGFESTQEVSASAPIEGVDFGAKVSTTESFSTTGSRSSSSESSTLTTFTETSEVTTTIECVPPYRLWQWRVTLTAPHSGESATGRANLFNCAGTGPDDGPPNVHDINWLPKQPMNIDRGVTTEAASQPATEDRPLQTADGRTFPANMYIEYRGEWNQGPGAPAAAARNANLVFFMQPIDGKFGYYCYNIDGVPACDDIAYVYSEPQGKRAWAVHRLQNPGELLMFVENRGFGEIDGQWFPDKNDAGKRPPAGSVTMTLAHHP